jgi:hypothetical protein
VHPDDLSEGGISGDNSKHQCNQIANYMKNTKSRENHLASKNQQKRQLNAVVFNQGFETARAMVTSKNQPNLVKTKLLASASYLTDHGSKTQISTPYVVMEDNRQMAA